MPTVIDLANDLTRSLDRRDLATINRIINAYAAINDRLQDSIDALIEQIANSGNLTRGQVERLERFNRLIAQTNDELDRFQSYLATEVDQSARSNISIGSGDIERLIRTIVNDNGGVLAGFNRLPTKAIERLVGFLDRSGPLFSRMQGLGQFVAYGMRAAILEGVGLGRNPRRIAREITNALGVGLTDALRITRTAQIYSYREAGRAVMAANENIVSGWYWYAFLGDNRVCMSCIAQHGTLHNINETLNDHHNGRCIAIPAVAGVDSPIEQSGEDWFKGQPEVRQRALMGNGKFLSWQAGGFDFGSLSVRYDDGVYGTMRREATLTELLGNKSN